MFYSCYDLDQPAKVQMESNYSFDRWSIAIILKRFYDVRIT